MTERKNPTVMQTAPGEEVICIFGETPVTRRGYQWLPVTQLIAWGLFSRASRVRNPEKSWFRAGLEGFCQMVVMLGSEWGHNLAHLVASNRIGKPMDEFRVQLGMPRCVYHELEDPQVTPRQHLVRAWGGPLFNLLVLPFTCLARLLTRKESIAGISARTAFDTNLFLGTISLLPIPGIDGGPILKWGLVERGKTTREADQVVQKANGPLALILGLFSSWAFSRKKILAACLSLMLAGTSLSIFAGWLKEEDVSI